VIYFPNLSFSLTLNPFHWWRFEFGSPWNRDGAEAVWLTLGPLDISIGWGG
jgi:hypothetical protein